MNTELLKSKKFRAATLAAISSTLAFSVAKLGLDWDVSEIMGLVSAISAPFLIYIGAEGFSEARAKAVVEENLLRKQISDQVIDQIITSKKE